jgi:hypothetical protein
MTSLGTIPTTGSPHIWFGAAGDFIGAVGVNTIKEFAELASLHPDIAEALSGRASTVTPEITPDEILEAISADVHATRVPASMVNHETWDNSRTFPMAIDDNPGRGYVKVLGVTL